MRREQFSFLEISQDPLLTILALVLLSTLWLIIPSGIDSSRPTGDEERERVRRLEQRKQSLEADLQRLQDEWRRLGYQVAAPGVNEPVTRTDRELEEKIAAFKADLATRTKQMESLQAELRRLQDSSGGTATAAAALQARLDELRKAIEGYRRELDALDLQIQSATQRAAAVRGEQDKSKAELARLQNEERSKRAELEKLQKERSSLEPKPVIQGDAVFKTKKSKTIGIQLANNHLIPMDLDYYEVKESGYIQRNGRNIPAARLCRKAGVLGDDVGGLGTAQSALSKVLSKMDPKTERVMLYVNQNSFEIMRKAIQVISRKGIEVGWWPDSDESPCYVATGGSGTLQLPSRRGQTSP